MEGKELHFALQGKLESQALHSPGKQEIKKKSINGIE